MSNTHAGQVQRPSQFFMHILQCIVQKFGRTEAAVGTATLKVIADAFNEGTESVRDRVDLAVTEAEAMVVKPLARQFE
jgi:hypothetical protein